MSETKIAIGQKRMLIKAMYFIISRVLVSPIRLRNHPSGLRRALKKAGKQSF